MNIGRAMIVARKDIREALRSRITYLYIGMLVLISIPYVQSVRSAIDQVSGIDETTLAEACRLSANLLLYTLPLFSLMLFSSFLSTYSVITEKAKRTLESLLATPASLREVWLGKSLAVAIPSTVVTVLLAVAGVVALNAAFVVPKVGHVVYPSVMAVVTAVIIIPLMAFFVVAIVTMLQLIITNPRLANFAFMAIFLAVYIGGVTQLAGRLEFHWIYLGLTVVLGLATFFVSPLLTKERVVLSSKG